MGRIGKKKCLEFGVFRHELTSDLIQKANALQGLKNAFFHFSKFLPHSTFFLQKRPPDVSIFPYSTYTLLI